MKRLMIILPLAGLMAALSCSDIGFEYDNPLDSKGTNYGYKITTSAAPTTSGKVVADGTPVPATADGTPRFKPNTPVKVTATAYDDYEFLNWTAVSGTLPAGIKADTTTITFNINNDVNIRANFRQQDMPTDSCAANPTTTQGCPGYDVCIANGPTPECCAAQPDFTGCMAPNPVYSITFNANGGTVTPASANTNNNGQLTSLPTPTRSGYTFDGWYTSSSGGTGVTTSTTFTANTTIYARWTAESSYTSKGNNINNYRVVQIGTQKWMAENLDYDVAGSVCYNNSADSCAKYGRLYNWEAAIKACPAGWHLPSDAEWSTLVSYVERDKNCSSCAGTKLKSPNYWESYSGVPKGTDDYGFAALPAGYGYSDGSFDTAGYDGFWWSATEYYADYASRRNMNYFSEYVYRDYNVKAYLFSVRCVQD
jgi:uncharacterized protein (TIGR02145 family)/uncharacterized repeat protein (TIGR02543 family)